MSGEWPELGWPRPARLRKDGASCLSRFSPGPGFAPVGRSRPGGGVTLRVMFTMNERGAFVSVPGRWFLIQFANMTNVDCMSRM
jgi:hypothetical protein